MLAKLTTKNQITIPKEVRDHLRLETGDRVDFVIEEDGKVQIKAVERPLEDLFGFLHRPGLSPPSLEGIDEGLAEDRADDDERIRRGER